MKDLNDIVEPLRKVFVSLERYELEVPQLKAILYGAIGLIVVGVFSAWIALVVGAK
jgi:hypothetical protein